MGENERNREQTRLRLIKAGKDLNFDTYNSLTPNWYYKVLR